MIYLSNFIACSDKHFNPSQTNHNKLVGPLLTTKQHHNNCEENLSSTYESRADGVRLWKIRFTNFGEATYHVERQEAGIDQHRD